MAVVNLRDSCSLKNKFYSDEKDMFVYPWYDVLHGGYAATGQCAKAL
jgi:hypothetical protein